MKKTVFFLSTLALLGTMACNKFDAPVAVPEEAGSEITLGVLPEGIDMNVDTKATAVTAVPSTLYWGATTGTIGNAAEAKKWAAASASVSSSKIKTGKYQTATPTAYNYYVANQTFTIPATGASTMTATNTTDVIYGKIGAQTATSVTGIALKHIFSRTGTLTGTAVSGSTVSNVSWKIVGSSTINGTAGTFNLTTGAWTAASTKLSTATTLTSSSDMYLIPGTYTITVTYTISKGDASKTLTRSGNVTLVMGKKNNISCTLDWGGSEPSEIELGVTLEDWGTNNITLTLG